jgi:hypothetical protein
MFSFRCFLIALSLERLWTRGRPGESHPRLPACAVAQASSADAGLFPHSITKKQLHGAKQAPEAKPSLETIEGQCYGDIQISSTFCKLHHKPGISRVASTLQACLSRTRDSGTKRYQGSGKRISCVTALLRAG